MTDKTRYFVFSKKLIQRLNFKYPLTQEKLIPIAHRDDYLLLVKSDDEFILLKEAYSAINRVQEEAIKHYIAVVLISKNNLEFKNCNAFSHKDEILSYCEKGLIYSKNQAKTLKKQLGNSNSNAKLNSLQTKSKKWLTTSADMYRALSANTNNAGSSSNTITPHTTKFPQQALPDNVAPLTTSPSITPPPQWQELFNKAFTKHLAELETIFPPTTPSNKY